jgi:hypothetical protein
VLADVGAQRRPNGSAERAGHPPVELQEVGAHHGESHVPSLLATLNARDRVQAVVLAYETGFVQPGPDSLPEPGTTVRSG